VFVVLCVLIALSGCNHNAKFEWFQGIVDSPSSGAPDSEETIENTGDERDEILPDDSVVPVEEPVDDYDADEEGEGAEEQTDGSNPQDDDDPASNDQDQSSENQSEPVDPAEGGEGSGAQTEGKDSSEDGDTSLQSFEEAHVFKAIENSTQKGMETV
jgi:hypothetical protein